MNNQIINIPATTFTGLANHFRNMHPEGIKGAVDVHSPDFMKGRACMPTLKEIMTAGASPPCGQSYQLERLLP